jgi:hypothetical protein
MARFDNHNIGIRFLRGGIGHSVHYKTTAWPAVERDKESIINQGLEELDEDESSTDSEDEGSSSDESLVPEDGEDSSYNLSDDGCSSAYSIYMLCENISPFTHLF